MLTQSVANSFIFLALKNKIPLSVTDLYLLVYRYCKAVTASGRSGFSEPFVNRNGVPVLPSLDWYFGKTKLVTQFIRDAQDKVTMSPLDDTFKSIWSSYA